MKTTLKTAARFALLAVLLTPVPGFAGTAEVTFTAPESFSDAARHRGPSRELTRTLAQLEKHIAKLAGRLPADQTLAVEVTDIDLAGWIEPSAIPYDIRVLRDVHPPRITLRYTLVRKDVPLVSGESTLTDLAYLHRIATGFADDPLRYEKRLLTAWFRKTITDPAN